MLAESLDKQLPTFHDSTEETEIMNNFIINTWKNNKENNMVYRRFENLDLKVDRADKHFT